MFWVITISYSAFISVSLSVTFLTIDRFFTIALPIKYCEKPRKLLAVVNVCSQVILYFTFVFLQVQGYPGISSINEYISKFFCDFVVICFTFLMKGFFFK